MTADQTRAVLTLSLMAAFADQRKDEREREQIRTIADSLSAAAPVNVAALYQDVLLRRVSLESAVAALDTAELRQLAYEMAVCVCDADGAQDAGERAFLERLRGALGLDAGAAAAYVRSADAVVDALPVPATLPVAAVAAATSMAATTTPADTPPAAPARPAVDEAELDRSILNYSILNGALELLPQSLASMAIIPLQMKMVYEVGRRYGYELDRGHIRDLLATMGVGMTGQYVEQIGRKLLGGLLGGVAGKLGRAAGRQAASSAMSFATTWALGQVAKRYYSGGRTLEALRLKELFNDLLGQAQTMRAQYAPQIEERARTIDITQLAQIVRQ